MKKTKKNKNKKRVHLFICSPLLGQRYNRREKKDRGWEGWMASPTQWTWVWDREAWRAVLHEVANCQTRMSNWTELNFWEFGGFPDGSVKNLPAMWETWIQSLEKIPWRREWQPTPVFLLEEFHGQKPGELRSMGMQNVRQDWMIIAPPQQVLWLN